VRDGSPSQGAPRISENHQKLRTERDRHRDPRDSRQVTNPADSIISDIKENLLSHCVAGRLYNFIHLSCSTVGQ